MQVTKELARFIAETPSKAFPLQALSVAKRAMLDCLGVALAGSLEPASRKVASLVRRLGGEPRSGVIGGGFRTSPPYAALANGTAAHALDYDDIAPQGHPSTTLLPAVLAVGEHLHASGRAVLEAYIIGFEASARVAEGTGAGPRDLGFHPTATLGTLGAASASTRLLRLNAARTAMALGLAASQAGGLGRNRGTMTKPFHAGNAARSGVVAALLAEAGFTAASDALEGRFGFCHAFSGGRGYDTASITRGLGQTFFITQGIGIKKYPSCYVTHRAIDAMLHLCQIHDIRPEGIERVECQVDPAALDILTYAEPSTSLQAKFSMQFCLAAAALRRRVSLGEFTPELLSSAPMSELMGRITMRPRPERGDAILGTTPDTVVVRLKDGREYRHGVARARGHPELPLTREELAGKYRQCAMPVLGEERAKRSLSLMESLEELSDISELMDLMVAAPSSPG